MSLLDAAGVVTGDIWCSGAFSFESPLKDLLDSGEYSLDQLLGEDELLQELRGVHPQLIEFFSTEEAVAGLIRYVTLPPDALNPSKAGPNATNTEESESNIDESGEAAETKDSSDGGSDAAENDVQDEHDAVHIRYPYMACEVICCEVKGIIDLIVDGFVPESDNQQSEEDSEEGEEENTEAVSKDPRPQTILDLLFSMLYDAKPGEIDDYRAGYFDKILSILFRKRPQALSDYINEGGSRGTEALMKAMFNHLYSHSIMQIVQRLLLPQPPLPPKDDDSEEKDGDDLYSDPLDGADMDGLGSFRCNWSESEFSLNLLLECLIGNGLPGIEEEEELRLSLYQNASEVLITIIQNSPLTSPTLHVLTKNPVLEKLIMAASHLGEGTSFSPHDSRLTCTMNVLESLILQLGGYGSVGTVMYDDEEEELGEDGQGQNGEGDDGAPTQPRGFSRELATSDTLISHLPVMLTNLCHLLLYPEADNWLSPMQFSRREPQKLLGSSRLRIVRLLESLVLLGDPIVDSLLCESSCLEVCLDLFWKFQWCSMLHQSVANLLVHVFEGANARADLQSYFLVKCNLLGRLMDSFWEGQESVLGLPAGESEARLSEAVMAMKNVDSDIRTSSVESERGSENSKEDVLPVSDDDVDAALETGNKESEDVAPDGDMDDAEPSPTQAFRLGYMGHVIIICQALVHACTNDGNGEGQSVEGTDAGESRPEMNGELDQYVDRYSSAEPPVNAEEGGALHDDFERGRTGESVVTDETPSNPLILAQLVETHSLSVRWQDFVTTTLASETAIQSTPLGGFAGSPGMDPLHSHRPGLEDDGGYGDDDGAAPPLPPRGLLVGGDVIDMDDNDLDVAASMMAGLSLGQAVEGDGNQRHDGDMLHSIPQQGGQHPGSGYMFDDPLGGGRFGGEFDEDDDSSSDEESEMSGNTGGSGGAVLEGVTGEENADAEAPVMDLFAGNLDAFGGQATGNNQSEGWSDFANFDDAFAGAEGTNSGNEGGTDNDNGGMDDVFGQSKDHAILLDEFGDDGKVEDDEVGGLTVKIDVVENANESSPVPDDNDPGSPHSSDSE